MEFPGRERWVEAAVADQPAVEPGSATLAGAALAVFTLGVAGTSAAWAGIAEVETAAVGFLALATGLVIAVPALATDFLGYLRIPPGAGLRRQAATRWLTLAAAATLFLAAALVLDDGYRSGEVSGFGAGVAGCGELVLVLGAVWVGRRPASRLGADEVEARRDLSRHLRPGAFPADRDRLVAEPLDDARP